MQKLFLSALLALVAGTATAQEVVIKLGTLAPNGSAWHDRLKDLGERWAQASGGKVRLKVYPGGALGNEGDMVRKMAVGQLQAASITEVGLHDITPAPQALALPLVIESLEEFQYVLGKVKPRLEADIEKKGYVVLQWAEVGFIRFFCAKPYSKPSEMGDVKLFTWDGDPAAVEGWKAAGFRPVVLSSTDILPSLQTGMINCVTQPPLYVFTARLFEKAPNMIDLNWGHLAGATVVRKEVWERIPADLRPRLLEIAREIGVKVDEEVRKLDRDAVEQMKRQGLKVIAPTDLPAWRAAGEASWKVLRGRSVPADAFDDVLRAREEFRAGRR